MLQSLQIQNYALIRSLEVSFDQGFTVITGETGAGKSIIMGALALILGNRADTDVLYDKSRKCIVEGHFDIANLKLQHFFEENDLDYHDITIIRREINENGKSRAFINDTPVNLTILKALTSSLIDIHSQHQNLMLQDSNFQLDLIDQFAQNQEIKKAYRTALVNYQNTQKRFTALKEQCAQAAMQHEFNIFTLNEIEEAQLGEDEQEESEQAVRILSHAEDIKSHLYASAQSLSEQENDNIVQRLKAVEHECSALKDLGTDYADLYNRIENVIAEVQDIAYEITAKEQKVEINPQELDRLNERLDLIYTLQHKYQVESIADLLALASKLKAEVDQYADNKEQLVQLERECQQSYKLASEKAKLLTASRQKALPSFEQKMIHNLQQLGMPDSRFSIRLSPTENLQATGTDSALYLFSANKGQEPMDLGKVASGGEISRIMLALKSIITDTTLLPTVIFDEIDTGISGETANKVGTMVGKLAQQHQVIVITHLPQIAARATRHYLVYKENQDNTTRTNLKVLTRQEREHVIATMMSGENPSQAALAAAQDLLKTSSIEK